MATRTTPVADRGYRWDDFVKLGEDDLRELIDGDLLEVEVLSKLHENTVSFLNMALRLWTRAEGGLVLGSGYKIRITEARGVMPDLQLFRKGRESVGGPQGLESGAPDLVVEVVSPTSVRYDRVVKLRWYAQIGVPEYWIIDPEGRTLERLILEGTGYRIAEALTDEATFSPDSFPGLSIRLEELFHIPGE